MPENVWTDAAGGGSVGLWNVPGNWSLDAKPADGHDIVLNGTQPSSITGGFEDFDGADLPIVRSFHRHPNYTGNVGTSGNPLTLATVARDDEESPYSSQGKVIVQGPGNFFYKNGTHGTGEITAALYIDTDNQDTDIEVNGAINRLHLLKGQVTGLSDLLVATIAVGFRANPNTDVHLTLQGSQAIAGIAQVGGTIINTGSAQINNFDISGGTFDHGVSAGILVEIRQTGGLVIHRAVTTVAVASILGGTLDMSQDARAKTVQFLQVFPGAEFKQNANITITQGGTILPITDIVPRSF